MRTGTGGGTIPICGLSGRMIFRSPWPGWRWSKPVATVIASGLILFGVEPAEEMR